MVPFPLNWFLFMILSSSFIWDAPISIIKWVLDISLSLKVRFIFKMKHPVELAMHIGCENVVN